MSSELSISFIIITVILSSIVVCTIVGNFFVITAILIDKNLQTTANQLVLSLAVADLMVACLVMPLGAYNDIYQGWYLGKEVCEFWTSADVLCCTASILNLLAIAIDRYWAVTNVDYIYKRTRRRVNLMVLCAWTVGAVVSLAPIFGWKDPDFADRVLVEHKCMVSQDVAYQIFATISTFYAPLVLLLALYWRIFQVARKRIRRKPGRQQEQQRQQQQQATLSVCGDTTRAKLDANLQRKRAVGVEVETGAKCQEQVNINGGNSANSPAPPAAASGWLKSLGTKTNAASIMARGSSSGNSNSNNNGQDKQQSALSDERGFRDHQASHLHRPLRFRRNANNDNNSNDDESHLRWAERAGQTGGRLAGACRRATNRLLALAAATARPLLGGGGRASGPVTGGRKRALVGTQAPLELHLARAGLRPAQSEAATGGQATKDDRGGELGARLAGGQKRAHLQPQPQPQLQPHPPTSRPEDDNKNNEPLERRKSGRLDGTQTPLPSGGRPRKGCKSESAKRLEVFTADGRRTVELAECGCRSSANPRLRQRAERDPARNRARLLRCAIAPSAKPTEGAHLEAAGSANRTSGVEKLIEAGAAKKRRKISAPNLAAESECCCFNCATCDYDRRRAHAAGPLKGRPVSASEQQVAAPGDRQCFECGLENSQINHGAHEALNPGQRGRANSGLCEAHAEAVAAAGGLAGSSLERRHRHAAGRGGSQVIKNSQVPSVDSLVAMSYGDNSSSFGNSLALTNVSGSSSRCSSASDSASVSGLVSASTSGSSGSSSSSLCLSLAGGAGVPGSPGAGRAQDDDELSLSSSFPAPTRRLSGDAQPPPPPPPQTTQRELKIAEQNGASAERLVEEKANGLTPGATNWARVDWLRRASAGRNQGPGNLRAPGPEVTGALQRTAAPQQLRALDIRRKFRALGQLVSFVQTSRNFNSSSSTPSSSTRSLNEEAGTKAAAHNQPRARDINGAGDTRGGASRCRSVAPSSVAASLGACNHNSSEPRANGDIDDPRDESAARVAGGGGLGGDSSFCEMPSTSSGSGAAARFHVNFSCQPKDSTVIILGNQTDKTAKTTDKSQLQPATKGSHLVEKLQRQLEQQHGLAGAEPNGKRHHELLGPLAKTNQSAELAGSALKRNQSSGSSLSKRRETMDIRREKKAAKTLAIITGVFVCCWLPFFLNAIIMPICGPSCTPSDLILSILLWLGYLNSLLNPIIYTIFSPDFRRAFRRLLTCWPELAHLAKT